jgi:NAD(P)-dependent dehydrogenase (short-subunit alcohol dehydrogenase family)
MDLNLKQKVVGVSGAASPQGIGFAIAKKMLEEGARVFICDLKEDATQAAVDLLSPYGEAYGFSADVSDEESVATLFERAMACYGAVDVFVSNAGIYPQQMLAEMSVSQWDTVMGVNLRSVFLCAKEAFRHMKQRGGVLINAASYAALIGNAGSGAYAASKAAVYSLTKTLAAEFAPYDIRVCGFIPGVIETGMTRQVVEQRSEQLLEQIALRRLGKPQDVANAVAFLVSDAASYMTGTFVEVSGGKLCVQNPSAAYARMEN